jgi:hypothetical protein
MMFGIQLTLFVGMQIAGLIAFAGLVYVALRLSRLHKRDRDLEAQLDNRHRSIFQPGVADRLGDRSAELLSELREDGTRNGA